MDSDKKISWSALEYEEKERSKDWFWALGIIVVTSAIAAIIFEDYFFAVLIVIIGALFSFLAVRKPRAISYEVNAKGVQAGTHLYPYGNIHSFWVRSATLRDHEENDVLRPMLFIRIQRLFVPIFSIPIDDSIAENIDAQLKEAGIVEARMQEHPSEHIMEMLGV